MTTSVKNNFMPPSLISNLQHVLATRNDGAEQQSHHHIADSTKLSSSSAPPSCASLSSCSGIEVGNKDGECVKPIVLVTNAEGIETPGLIFLVEALVLDARLDVCVCAPQLDIAFFSSKYPQMPLTLLQYHAVPLKLDSHEYLSSIHHGFKIDTLLLGHPLVVTTFPTHQYESLNEVRVTEWNLYNDGGLIVHGVDNLFDPAFQTLLYPRFDVKKDGILDTQVSKFSRVEELPNKWYSFRGDRIGFASVYIL